MLPDRQYSMRAVFIPFLTGFVIPGVMMVLESFLVSLKYRIPVREFLKGVMPGAFIAFTTASSAAAFHACKKGLTDIGVKKSNADMFLPLEQPFFHPFSACVLNSFNLRSIYTVLFLYSVAESKKVWYHHIRLL